MISILRKIRQKLLSQNRVSRYLAYAVGEILLVMIGILLALQVNNWNDWRKNQEEKITLLKAIKQEFQGNLERIKNHREELVLRNKYGLAVLNISAGQQSNIPMDSVRYYASLLIFPQTPLLTKSTIEEAVSSGKFGMLDSELAIQLSMYLDYLEGFREMNNGLSQNETAHDFIKMGAFDRIFNDYFPEKKAAIHPEFKLDDAAFFSFIQSAETYSKLTNLYMENTSKELWIQAIEETLEKSLEEIEKSLNP